MNKIAFTIVLVKLIAALTLALAALANADVSDASLLVASQQRWDATFNDDALLDASQVVDQGAPAQPASERCRLATYVDYAGASYVDNYCAWLDKR